jgi:hypothetical protein
MKPLLPAITSAIAGLAIGAAAYLATKPAEAPVKTMAPAKIERMETTEAALLASSDKLEQLRDPALPNRTGRVALWLPHASLQEVESLWARISEEKPHQDVLASLVFARWVMLDVKGAMAASTKWNGSAGAWEAWAAWDPRAAEAAARESTDRTALIRVLMTLAGKDPEYVLKQLQQEAVGGGYVIPKLIDGFIDQSRYDKAMEVAVQFSQGFMAREKILKAWSKQSPEEVLRWGYANPHLFASDQNDGVVASVVQESMDKMPEILGKMPAGKTKGRVQRAYLQALAGKDPARAIDFAEKSVSPVVRNDLLGTMGRKYAASNPEKAVEILGKLLDGGAPLGEYPVAAFFAEGPREGWHSTDSAAAGFAEDLMIRMPEQAMDAVMSESGKPAYQQAARQFAADWMERDRWDFGTWLAKQPADPLRDELVQGFSQRLVGGSQPAFPEAMNWANSMGDAASRDRLIDQFLQRWEMRDPDGLKSYLSAADTPAAVQARAKKK